MTTNKKRLTLETNTAAKADFEEHKEHHTHILMDLERQKQRLERSLRRLEESKKAREDAEEIGDSNHTGMV